MGLKIKLIRILNQFKVQIETFKNWVILVERLKNQAHRRGNYKLRRPDELVVQLDEL